MNLMQIQDLLDKVNGCTFAGLDCVTDVKLAGGRKNPYQGKLVKHCYGNRVMLFTNKLSNGYENMVRRRLVAEGKDPSSFQLGELVWGTRLPNSPIIEHKNQHYLQVIFLVPGEPQYFATDDIYWYLDNGEKFVAFKKGDEVPKRCIKGLPEHKGSGRQGLEGDNKVVVRTYSLDSIRCIRLFKEERCDALEFQLNHDDVLDDVFAS